MRKYLTSFLLLLSVISASGQNIIELSRGSNEYFIPNSIVEIFEDTSGRLLVDQVADLNFKMGGSDFFTNSNPESVYWVKFSVKNNSDKINWIIEQFNYRIHDLTLYYQVGNNSYQKFSLGDNRSFRLRNIHHKNLIYQLPIPKGETVNVYFSFSTEHETPFQLVIREASHFTSYALSEYFLLGIFYGIILIIAVYNFILYFSFRDKAYLFYVFYVVCFGVYFMVLDGTAFQYLWPNLPSMNVYGYALFLFLTSVGITLFAKAFLNIPEKLPVIDKVLNGFIIFRTGFYLLTFLIPAIREVTYLEIFPFMVIYLAAIVAYSKGYKPALYFVISFTLLFIAFSVHISRIFGWVPSNLFTFYSLYLAPLMEIVLLSIAQSQRIKELSDEKEINERLMADLEAKVNERTYALKLQNEFVNEQMKSLDGFVYKVSHDLKGPVRSILGLAKSAKTDQKTDPQAYFDYIIKSCERLDAVISDLLSLARTTGKKLNIQPVVIKEIVDDVLDSIKGNIEREQVDIEVINGQVKEFYSERSLLYSVIQNLIENSIHYRRDDEAYLKISIAEKGEEIEIIFSDNGIGIGKEHVEKIFDMFYRADEKHHHKSTGLGLYTVKMALDRLEGNISVSSEEGVGTTFSVSLKNLKRLNIDNSWEDKTMEQV